MKPLRPASDALPTIRSAIAGLTDDLAAWVQIDLLKREIERQVTDFDPRTFGYLTLKDLLLALRRAVVVDQSGEGGPRVKLQKKKPKAKTKQATRVESGSPDD